MQPPQRGRLAEDQSLDHFTYQGQLDADKAGIGARLGLPGKVLAERTGGITGHEIANLVELQEIEGVDIHV